MDKDDIMILRMDDVRFQENDSYAVLKNEVKRLSFVENASFMFSTPPYLDTEVPIAAEEAPDSQRMVWSLQSVDETYLDTFSIRLLEGRSIPPGARNGDVNEILINETAARMLGAGSPIGRKIRAYIHGDHFNACEIVGVVGDFHGRSLHHSIQPMFLEKTNWGTLICLKIDGHSAKRAVADVTAVWKRLFPNNPIDYFFLEDEFRSAYRTEERLNLISRSFSGLAIFIACLGLLGLVAFSTDQRRKEIGIRKVLGSSPGRLLGLFLSDFSRPILLSNLAAWPIAYFLFHAWLQGFAYRMSLPIWIFPAGGLLTAAIAFLTIEIQILRAVRVNPVEILRYE